MRVYKKRTRPRSKTLSRKTLRRKWGPVLTLSPEEKAQRPKTRAECPKSGPCPWVACRHHLYLDVNPETGSIKINFPDLEPWELPATCALDVASRGGMTLQEVGDVMNLTRERVRQVEISGLLKLHMVRRKLK